MGPSYNSRFYVTVKVWMTSKKALLLPLYLLKLPSWMTHLEFFEQFDLVSLNIWSQVIFNILYTKFVVSQNYSDKFTSQYVDNRCMFPL
jgi:predicted permease